MKRFLILPVLVGAGVLTFAVVGGGAGTGGGKIIHVVEHATTDATTDTGAPGDSAGDVLAERGGKLAEIYVRLGCNDVDELFEAPDDETAFRILLELSRHVPAPTE